MAFVCVVFLQKKYNIKVKLDVVFVEIIYRQPENITALHQKAWTDVLYVSIIV